MTKDILGAGAFAEVRRCRHRQSGAVYALKHMCKADVLAMGQVEHILQETQILSHVGHPNVTNKVGSIVTPGSLIILMEYVAVYL